MKCMTCNECSDKKYCAVLNGLAKVPYPLTAYKIKGCHDIHLGELNKIKEEEKMSENILARRIEENLNSLEVAVSKLHENIVCARTDLLKIIDRNEKLTKEAEKKAKEGCYDLLHSEKGKNGLANYEFWQDGYEHGFDEGERRGYTNGYKNAVDGIRKKYLSMFNYKPDEESKIAVRILEQMTAALMSEIYKI